MSRPVKETSGKRRVGDGTPGPGRPKGTPNKTTGALKDAILHAFDKVGGEDYLVTVARNDPRTFCTLLGRVLPAEFKGEVNGGHTVIYGAQPVTAEEWSKQYAPH
jgi:hypothetical protein